MTIFESRRRKWTATLVGLALLGIASGAQLIRGGLAPQDAAAQPTVMVAEDGTAYLVEPWETLGEAIQRKAVFHRPRCEAARVQEVVPAQEQGPCVPADLKNKPKDAVSCKCYEETECNGTESHRCERHCRKDLCNCCSI
jgi:hypothetical protein